MDECGFGTGKRKLKYELVKRKEKRKTNREGADEFKHYSSLLVTPTKRNDFQAVCEIIEVL